MAYDSDGLDIILLAIVDESTSVEIGCSETIVQSVEALFPHQLADESLKGSDPVLNSHELVGSQILYDRQYPACLTYLIGEASSLTACLTSAMRQCAQEECTLKSTHRRCKQGQYQGPRRDLLLWETFETAKTS